jgi:anti-sigma regulatory factor (Ser/Thr protein kinase)
MRMRHSLLVYDDDDRMVERMAPFLSSGLADGERAVVVLDRWKWEPLAGALGSVADNALYIERDAFYTRPEAAVAGYDGTVRRFMRDGATGIRVFGEVPRCETDAQWDLWLRYEAILNRAFEHHPVWIVCGYDAREVPGPLLDEALDTHPETLEDGWRRSPHYHEPEDVVRSRTPTPAPPLAGLHALALDGGPRGFREALSAELEAAAVSEVEAGNMLVAAEEVLANGHRHGGETVRVHVGGVGDRFVCEVSDDGPGIDDPLTGFLPPRPGHADGAGLWVARQLTRQLELVPSAHGATVRLWV